MEEKKVIFSDGEAKFSSFPELMNSIFVRDMIEHNPDEDISLHNFEMKWCSLPEDIPPDKRAERIVKSIIFWDAINNPKAFDLWVGEYIHSKPLDEEDSSESAAFSGCRQILEDFNFYGFAKDIFLIFEFYIKIRKEQYPIETIINSIENSAVLCRYIKNLSTTDEELFSCIYYSLKDWYDIPPTREDYIEELLGDYSKETIGDYSRKDFEEMLEFSKFTKPIEISINATRQKKLFNFFFEHKNKSLIPIIDLKAGGKALSIFLDPEIKYAKDITIINLKKILKKNFVLDVMGEILGGNLEILRNFHHSLITFFYGKACYDADIDRASQSYSNFFAFSEELLLPLNEKMREITTSK